MPFVGDTTLFISYRGMQHDICYQFEGGSDLTDHTIMAGFTCQRDATSLLG